MNNWGRWALGVIATAVVSAGCGAGEASVALVFPNSVVRKAIRRVRIEAYPPSTGGAAASDRDCRDFSDLAREGKDPLGTPTRGDYQCADAPETPCAEDWFDGLELLKVDSGRQIVYVLAYASTEDDATPVLEGCTDRFDSGGGGDVSTEVAIDLGLVIPDSARLVKTAGDRQVGRAGEEAPVPLQVLAEADSPTGTGGTYVIPGVPVRFRSEDVGFELVSDTGPEVAETFTDPEGHAEVRVRLPPMSGSGRVVARSALLEERVPADRAEQEFNLSVTEPVVFGSQQVLQSGGGLRPIQVVLGRLDSGDDLDLAMVACRGTEEGCARGSAAVAPFGEAVLTVVANLGAGGQLLPVTGAQGILPTGVAIADIVPTAGIDEIAVLSARRGECQDRVCPADGECKCYGLAPGEPCPCEGSEIRVFELENGQVNLQRRHTLTASNAVAITPYRNADIEPYFGLAVAAQGRSVHRRPCSRANRCLPFDPMVSDLCRDEPGACGCPPAERCECQGCSGTQDPGVCVARDKMVDLLVFDDARAGLGMFNLGGCQEPDVFCDSNAAEASSCTCGDSDVTGNLCTGRDGCNCKVPARIYIGDTDAPVLPYGLAAGVVDSARDWDIVVPSIGGLEIVESMGDTFLWKGEPIINAPIHAALILDLDAETERQTGAQRAGDVVWYSQKPCLAGSNFATSCPIWQAPAPGEEPAGCLGVYYSDGEDSIVDLRTPTTGGCRRHFLMNRPDGMCAGYFNDDDFIDVALASSESPEILVFAGDGRGGLLDPPERVTLPAGGVGGPLACGRIDGDGRDDVVVVDGESGAIYVLGTLP